MTTEREDAIAVAVIDGKLRIAAEFPVPNAICKSWAPARLAKLIELIQDFVAAAELVDAAEEEIDSVATVNRRTHS